MASVLCQQRLLRMDSGEVRWWVVYYDPRTTVAAAVLVYPTNLSLLTSPPAKDDSEILKVLHRYIKISISEQSKGYIMTDIVAYPDSSLRKDLLLGSGECTKKTTSSCQLLRTRTQLQRAASAKAMPFAGQLASGEWAGGGSKGLKQWVGKTLTSELFTRLAEDLLGLQCM